jgi:protein-S-isoprenylcysteine O-methyltransferase Ste14
MKPSAFIVTIVPLLLIAFLIRQFSPAMWSAPRVAGLVILIVAMTLLVIARVQLGNSFSVSPRATQLVTRGLYSRIRNPVYVFSSVALAGFILYLGRPRFFLVFVILIPLQAFRARAEARVLGNRFGDEYRKYRATTWF